MCYFMFFGIGFIFMIPLFSLSKPISGLCYFRRLIMGMSFAICYAPLLMKISRIYGIFKNSNQRPVGLMGYRFLLLITVALIAIQALFCALLFNTDPPKLVETTFTLKEMSVFLSAPLRHQHLPFILSIMSCCWWAAHSTRSSLAIFQNISTKSDTLGLQCTSPVSCGSCCSRHF